MALGSNQSRIGYHGSNTGTGSRIGQVTFSPRRISMFDTEGVFLIKIRILIVGCSRMVTVVRPSVLIASSGLSRSVLVHSCVKPPFLKLDCWMVPCREYQEVLNPSFSILILAGHRFVDFLLNEYQFEKILSRWKYQQFFFFFENWIGSSLIR